jgi:hypothetical protein
VKENIGVQAATLHEKERDAMKSVVLNNGVAMPIIGFGVFQIADAASVKEACPTPSKPAIA